jgi:hypothetical protein
MSKFLTPAEYREMAKKMAAEELHSLAETFNQSQTLKPQEIIIRDILNNEMERRIYNWEMVTV